MLLDKTSEVYKRLVFQVQNRMGDVPEVSAVYAIGESYRRLCEETELWVVENTHSISPNTLRYNVIGDMDATLRRIIFVKIKSLGDSTPFSLIDSIPSYWYDECDNGLVFKTNDILKMYSDGVMLTKVAVVPPQGNEVYLDPSIIERYASAVVYGAIVELAVQAGRPWYSGDMYALYSNRYNQEVGHILANKNSGFKDESESISG